MFGHFALVGWLAPFLAVLTLTFTSPAQGGSITPADGVFLPLLIAGIYPPFGMIFSMPAALASWGLFYLIRRLALQAPRWCEPFTAIMFPLVGAALGMAVSLWFDHALRSPGSNRMLMIGVVVGGALGALDYLFWRNPFSITRPPAIA